MMKFAGLALLATALLATADAQGERITPSDLQERKQSAFRPRPAATRGHAMHGHTYDAMRPPVTALFYGRQLTGSPGRWFSQAAAATLVPAVAVIVAASVSQELVGILQELSYAYSPNDRCASECHGDRPNGCRTTSNSVPPDQTTEEQPKHLHPKLRGGLLPLHSGCPQSPLAGSLPWPPPVSVLASRLVPHSASLREEAVALRQRRR